MLKTIEAEMLSCEDVTTSSRKIFSIHHFLEWFSFGHSNVPLALPEEEKCSEEKRWIHSFENNVFKKYDFGK
jgi:hypothetical protein